MKICLLLRKLSMVGIGKLVLTIAEHFTNNHDFTPLLEVVIGIIKSEKLVQH